MASQEEDNKPRVNSNVNNDREVNIISVYKRLENVLNNKTELFPNKVESLIQVWKQVSQCRLTEHKQYVVHLMDWLKLHTLNIVLTGDWKKFKDTYEERLLKEVKHCEMLLLHSNNIFSLRCRKLAEVIKDPWGSPILNKLLNNPDVAVGPEEIEFFSMETGYLISTRLRKLCESHCEDLALNLVTTFMRCHQMAELQQFSLNATEDQKRFILDVYIALLYKYKKTSLIISTLKSLSLKEGLELLKRFAHKRVNISKIWRHSNRIAHLAAQVYVTATVMKPPEESVSILEGLLETWLSLNETDNLDMLMSAVRRIIQAADSAVHMYIFCEAFHKKFGPAMKTFVIELYIRALTTDMNDLERQKSEDDLVKVVEISKRLAYGFLRLADVLEEHVKVSRECVLTSFSLQPTESTLDRIVNLAERCGYEVLDTGQNWKCKLHPPILETDDVSWKCDMCGDYMSQPELQTPLNTNTALSEALTAEQLGLSPQLCDDLVVVLSSPRYQLFSWLLRWQDLHRLCVLYLNDPERTKNLVTELKFLDIDYSVYMKMKKEPRDELDGIERGYEQYLEDHLYPEERVSPASDQDSRPYSLGSDGMGETPNLFPPPAAKSDPNVLKSLRLFRPSLKRAKPNQTEDELPPKVFVTSESISPLTTAHTTTSVAHHINPSNYYHMPADYMARYNPNLGNLFSAHFQPYGSINTENWHHMVGQSSSGLDVAQPLNFATNQSARAYSPQEIHYSNKTNTAYNFLTENTNVHQETSNHVDNSQLDHFKEGALNLSMNHQHTRTEKAEEQPGCSSNLTKDNTNYQKNVVNSKERPPEATKRLEQSNTNYQKNVVNSKERPPDATKRLEQSRKKALQSLNLKNLLANFPTTTKNISPNTQIRDKGDVCKKDPKLENCVLDRGSSAKYSQKRTNKESFLAKSTDVARGQMSNLPTTSHVNTSKNMVPSGSKESNEAKNDQTIPASTTDSSKNLINSSGNSKESEKSECNTISSFTNMPESVSTCATTEIGSHSVPLSSLDASKNLNSSSSVSEQKDNQFSATLPIPYVDMSKNVVTFASSGISKHEENHCLQGVQIDNSATVANDKKKFVEKNSLENSNSTVTNSDIIKHAGNSCAKMDTSVTVINSGMKKQEEKHCLQGVTIDDDAIVASAKNKNKNEEDLNTTENAKINASSTVTSSVIKHCEYSCAKIDTSVSVISSNVKKLAENRSSQNTKTETVINSNIRKYGKSNSSKIDTNASVKNSDVMKPKEDHHLQSTKTDTSVSTVTGDIIKKKEENDNVQSSKTVVNVIVANSGRKKYREKPRPQSSKIVSNSTVASGGVEKQDSKVDIRTTIVSSTVNQQTEDSTPQNSQIDLKTTMTNSGSMKKQGENCGSQSAKVNGSATAESSGVKTNAENTSRQLLNLKLHAIMRNKLVEILTGVSSVDTEPKSTLLRIDYNKDFIQGNNLNKPSNQGKQKVETSVVQRKTNTARARKTNELSKKYKLKEARVVLNRLTLTDEFKRKYGVITTEFVAPPIPKQKGVKKVIKKSENKNKDKLKGKSNINKNKNGTKPWPLQDINPKVNRRSREVKSHVLKKDKSKNGKSDFKDETEFMNPRVVLKRLELDARDTKDKKRIANSLLANVPGLNDLQMIRPSSVDRIVQVVQVPGARCTTSVPIQSTQTSTQVTPHIQRIGQPRTEKPDPSDADSTATSSVTATSSTVTTTNSESPTLINILSQQIIRPGTQTNCVGVRPRSSPLINILSQQIIKPATSVSSSAKVSSSSGSAEVQVNSIPRVITGGDQILSQLINPVRAPAPTLKTLVSAPASDQNRIVQFICKSSDGKLIPVTSFTSNKVVKVSMTQTVSSLVTGGNTSTDENFTKLAQTTCKTKTESAENSDTLPKFQQAFGKPAYQNNIDATECVTTNSDTTVSTDIEKTSSAVKTQPKNSSASLNVQPVQGGVIYTRQMPVGQTINLIPPGRGQVFRIATSNAEQLSLVKDTVIHGKMSALLAAALQGKQRTLDNNEVDISSEDSSQTNTRVAVTTRPTLVQNARIVKPVLQIPSNVIRSAPQSNLSSTTLEQLREFDMVYKQVKERSSTSVPTESSPQSDSNEPTQQISVTYLNQGQKISCSPVVVVSSYCNVQPAASPSLSVTSQGSSSPCVTPAPTLALSSKTATKSPKSKSVKSATTHTTKASPIPKPQQKPQEDEHTTQRIFDILAEYAEQLRNSPDLNNKPAPRRRSNPPTNPNQNAKRKKSSSSKKTGHCSNSLTSDGDIEDTHTVGSEDSSCGVVQISVQEEEQPLTTVSTSETNEASVSPKQLILTDSTPNQSRSLIIADSNVGEALKMSNTAVLVPGNYIMPVSMVKGGQQIAVVSGGSKILATVPARSGPNMLLFQSFLNQTRKHGLPTVKYSAVQPISGIARNMSSITAQTPAAAPPTSQNLTAVTLAQTVSLQKVNQLERTDINSFDTELLLTIAHPPENKSIVEQQQPEHRGIPSSTENVQSIRVGDAMLNSNSSAEKTFSYEEKSLSNASVATSVIAQSISIKEEPHEQPTATQTIMALNLNSSDSDKDTTIKVEGRVQSVLVATGTSNGPMLSHSPPAYSKQADSTNSISESNKDEYLRNEGKRSSAEPKTLSNVYAYQGKIKKTHVGSQRLDRELQQLTLQRKQAALERELRLQKSLSEECEDLGVDEPSTSDLFPEADLLFDSNHSPSFDQTSQDLVKRPTNVQEVKEETKTIGLFCDDEPMRTDFLFEPIEYHSAAVELEYDRARDMTNGQGSTSNESGLSCEDNTLLQTCTSMSDVTIPSPISPDPYADSSPPPLNKCKYKYSNRKKAERSKQVENWPMELSSSEDTTGSTELAKSCSRSPELFPGKRNRSLSCDEELYGFTIVERLPLKDDEECEEVHCEDVVDCPSGRGARRSVKKLCSCCIGTAKVARKRPASRPPTPFSHKKTVIAKKR